MDKQDLSTLFTGKLFYIPDYQRGYAWEKKQWKDFVEDIDALVEEKTIKSHYTGTIVTFTPSNEQEKYNRKLTNKVDIVDGQQRLTTTCLYLSCIIGRLAEQDSEYEQEKSNFLFSKEQCKLTPANETKDIFLQLLKGNPTPPATTPHAERLKGAHQFFKNHIKDRSFKEVEAIFEAMTGKMFFTYYEIEEECEIGMTFELMNSRGKGLSILELLKNYFMHWVSRNVKIDDKKDITDLINNTWKAVYANIGRVHGNEERCLRYAWILMCDHNSKNWKGYEGFKLPQHMPLRNFTGQNKKSKVKDKIVNFIKELNTVSLSYANTLKPKKANTDSLEEMDIMKSIHNTGSTANFFPLIVAANIQKGKEEITQAQYVKLLQAIEIYIYRVYLFAGKRSNTGLSKIHSWAKNLYEHPENVESITSSIYDLSNYYISDRSFKDDTKAHPDNWYSAYDLLKYTLFEYERHLVSTSGKGKKPNIRWSDISHTSIEHILPQTPKSDSQWLKDWDHSDFSEYKHDLGNLVLTRHNSNYKNFEFSKKKGEMGEGIGYANSDIRQEREVSKFEQWKLPDLLERRTKLENFILERWALPEEYHSRTAEGLLEAARETLEDE